MKKLSILLVFSIILSVFTPVYAQNELESVILDCKSRLEIKDYENFDSSYYENDGEIIYNLSWGNNNNENYEFVEVRYSDGFIRNYSISKTNSNSQENKFPKFSIDDAMKIAEEFSEKVNPLQKDKIRVINNNTAVIGARYYNFTLQRFENGYPVRDEVGSIRVDNETGEVISYSMIFDTDAVFNLSGEILSDEQALKIYKNEFAPKLQYARYYNHQTKENKIYLEYISNENGKRIDAVTGEVIDFPTNYRLYTYNGALKEESAADSSLGTGLSPAELENAEKIKGLISKEDAEKIARRCTYLSLSDSEKLDKVSLYTYYTDSDKYVYNMSFGSKSVTVDAQSGDVISFYKNGEYDKDYTHDSENELIKANEAFDILAKGVKQEYNLAENENGNIRFVRFVNNTEVSFDNIYFNFDDNGELVSFSIDYTQNADFPTPDSILSSSEICDILKTEYTFSPMYAIDSEKNEGKLYYTFMEDYSEITFKKEPYSGKSINYKGDIVENSDRENFEYSDISGHWAEKQIQKLAEYGIGFAGGKLLGNNTITQKELVMLLGKAFENSTEYDYVLGRLLSEKIITKENYSEDKAITRSDASVIFIRMLGAEEYARFEGIYTAPFADVSVNKGYISLLKVLGVVSGDTDGYFYPNKLLTRAEALVMIYNYLSR